MRFLAAAAFAASLLAVPAVAAATPVELQLAAGPSSYTSTWSGDYGAGGSLRLGARFAHVFAIDLQGWESLATVNRRQNTGISFGVTGYLPFKPLHPYLRLFGIHQHEEGLVSVENAPAGVVLGIGAGIRHRAGAGFSLGAEVPVLKRGDHATFVVLANATGVYFPDILGPAGYFGVDLGVGLDYLL